MPGHKRHGRESDAAPTPHSTTRLEPLLRAVTLLLLLTVIAAAIWAMNRTNASSGVIPAPPPSPPAPAPPSYPIPLELRQRLIGQWLRPDGGYVLTIDAITPDGQLTATYTNPRPIHIAQARATQNAGRTALYVELRDRGYPGSYYTLTYDPAHDKLLGLYYHLGLGQTFDVRFDRLRKEVPGNP